MSTTGPRATIDVRRGAELDASLTALGRETRPLLALTGDDVVRERARLARALRRGERLEPRLSPVQVALRPDLDARLDDAARRATDAGPAAALYAARIDEMRADAEILRAVGRPERLRPLCRARFGCGRVLVRWGGATVDLAAFARAIVSAVAPTREPRRLAARAPADRPCVEALARRLVRRVGLDVSIRVEPRLTASAASGDRTLLLADRAFGVREALRVLVHEVLGHLTVAANGRAQPLGLCAIGTAGSLVDQEGLAVLLEERSGLLDAARLRMLAGRVLAVDSVHQGASFTETARALVREHGFDPSDAVVLAERAHRGGGLARDAIYLRGWLRVREAVARDESALEALWRGRVGLDDRCALDALVRLGLVRRARVQPDPAQLVPELESLAASRRATAGGTSARTSPPSRATSFTRLELT